MIGGFSKASVTSLLNKHDSLPKDVPDTTRGPETGPLWNQAQASINNRGPDGIDGRSVHCRGHPLHVGVHEGRSWGGMRSGGLTRLLTETVAAPMTVLPDGVYPNTP